MFRCLFVCFMGLVLVTGCQQPSAIKPRTEERPDKKEIICPKEVRPVGDQELVAGGDLLSFVLEWEKGLAAAASHDRYPLLLLMERRVLAYHKLVAGGESLPAYLAEDPQTLQNVEFIRRDRDTLIWAYNRAMQKLDYPFTTDSPRGREGVLTKQFVYR